MSTSTTVWYNDYTIYNELLRLSRLHKFNQFTFEYLMKYAVKGSQVILDEIELLNSAEVEDDENERGAAGRKKQNRINLSNT